MSPVEDVCRCNEAPARPPAPATSTHAWLPLRPAMTPHQDQPAFRLILLGFGLEPSLAVNVEWM
eukprot:3376047-Prymnesium_polylepis.1